MITRSAVPGADASYPENLLVPLPALLLYLFSDEKQQLRIYSRT
jgi:hypothetical protein